MVVDKHDYYRSAFSGKSKHDAHEKFGFFSHRQWCMEKDEWGAANSIDSIPPRTLLTFGTAKIPSLTSFWHGHDLTNIKSDTRAEKENRHRLVEERVLERAALLRLLENNSLLPEGLSTDPGTITQISNTFVFGRLCRSC